MTMRLSIVTTLYRSALYVQSFYERMSRAASTLTPDYEIIFVNDGSPDESLSLAQALQKKDPRVVVIDLARNFGHHCAIRAGLSYAQGDQVFLIDSDLEEDPQWLLLFSKRFNDTRADAIYGVQQARKGNFFERTTGDLFYRLFNIMSSVRIVPNAVTARLMTRRYVQAVLLYAERELFLPAIWTLAGHAQEAVIVQKGSRGKTSYSAVRRIALAIKALTSFSDTPLVAIFYTGLLISIGALSYAGYLIYRKLFHGLEVMGWPSLIVSIWFLGGVTIFFMGVIGIYLARIFVEIKQRPLVIVKSDSSQ